MPDLLNVFGLIALLSLSIGLGLLGAFGALSLALSCMSRSHAPRPLALDERAARGGQIIHGVAA